METGFDQLEEKVRKAADVVRRLRTENKSLQEELGRAKARVQDAEKAAADKPRGPSPEDSKRLDSLSKEIEGLRSEREEVRRRIGKLVQVLDALDAQE
jgi:FtsZ-binding cell division protein ZapB